MLLWLNNLGFAGGGTPRHSLDDELGGGDGNPAGLANSLSIKLEDDELLSIIVQAVTKEML